MGSIGLKSGTSVQLWKLIW